MKKSVYIILVLAVFLFVSINADEDTKKWCWVKPDAQAEKKVWDKENVGGPNWGWCAKPETLKEQAVRYTVSVKGGNIPKASSRGKFFILFSGEKGQTEILTLTNSGFTRGQTMRKAIMASPVGDVENVRLYTQSNVPYKCETVKVQVEYKFWVFDCVQEIACPAKCFADLTLRGSEEYDIMVQTSGDRWAESNAPIYISFIGPLGKSPIKLLSGTGFAKGSRVAKKVFSVNVGKLTKIELSGAQGDMWKPAKLTIKKNGRDETEFINDKDQYIKSPMKTKMILENNDGQQDTTAIQNAAGVRQVSRAGSGGGKKGGKGAGQSKPANGGSTETSDYINDYNGGGLTKTEKANILDATCSDIVKENKEFGPKYNGLVPNFLMIITRCPAKCNEEKTAKVYGVAVHPEESHICKAAITDGALSIYGGIIGVGIVKGRSTYDKSKKPVMGIKIESFKSSRRSFFTFKIDSADFAESDVRIMREDGQPHYRGRLEVRLNGRWGSVCTNGMNEQAARVICRSLKYKDGMLKSGNGESCKSFKGEDVCGINPSPIIYQSIKCTSHDTDIFRCYREMADNCSHNQDAVVECTNVNYDEKQDPDPGTIRMVDHKGKAVESKPYGGRAEYYDNGKWGSVCNKAVGDTEASVMCQQMGYDSGTVHGGRGKSGACARYKGKNHCGNRRLKIAMKPSGCKGTESKITKCTVSTQVSGCTHDDDTVLICKGDNGDASGGSQKSTHKAIGKPALGKLPLVPIIGASCHSKGDAGIFKRGENGSIFVVSCPKNCGNSNAAIFGTSLYTQESSVCKAAIHSGVIQNLGGLVELVKLNKIDDYDSTLRRGVQSQPSSKADWSFAISYPPSIAIKLTQYFNNKLQQRRKRRSFIQLDENDNVMNQTSASLPNDHQQSFMQLGIHEQTESQKASRLFLGQSFLQLKVKQRLKNKSKVGKALPKPVFQWWKPSANFFFDGKRTKVKTEGLPGEDKTGSLDKFTIATRFAAIQMYGKEHTIVAHSGCGGWALVMNKMDQLDFKARCTGPTFPSYYFVPVKFYISVAITYNGKYARIYINGVLYNEQYMNLKFKNDKHLDIGWFSEIAGQRFHGKIEYVIMYKGDLTAKQCAVLAAMTWKDRPRNDEGGPYYTVDKRRCGCGGACTSNPTPGERGAPNTPRECMLGMPMYNPGDIPEGMTDNEWKNMQKEIQEEREGEKSDNESDGENADCFKLGTSLIGAAGKQYRLQCPKECSKVLQGNVFGTLIYADESSLCKAAIHAGVIDDDKGGSFVATIANGMAFYQGGFQNDISGVSHGPATRSFTVAESAKIAGNLECKDTANMPMVDGPPGTRFTFVCPKNCSIIKPLELYGDGYYSDDSMICPAAIHQGVLSDEGGEVRVRIEKGLKAYHAIQRNGLESKPKGEYVRSFQLLGKVNGHCNYFRENYVPSDIFKYWRAEDEKESTNGPSKWTFGFHPTEQNSMAIQQLSEIASSGDDKRLATVLTYQPFDCADGVLRVNVYFEEQSGPAGIVFRYNSFDDYYALMINSKTPDGSVKLIYSKKDDVDEIAKTKKIKIEDKTWYSFLIAIYKKNVKVYYQEGDLRSTQFVFEADLPEATKGKVGLGTNNQKGTYFHAYQMKPYDGGNPFDENDNRRTFDVCLQETTAKIRKKKCENKFRGFDKKDAKPLVETCIRVQQYCSACCDREVDKDVENILNFICFKGCLFNAQMGDKAEKMKEAENQDKRR